MVVMDATNVFLTGLFGYCLLTFHGEPINLAGGRGFAKENTTHADCMHSLWQDERGLARQSHYVRISPFRSSSTKTISRVLHSDAGSCNGGSGRRGTTAMACTVTSTSDKARMDTGNNKQPLCPQYDGHTSRSD